MGFFGKLGIQAERLAQSTQTAVDSMQQRIDGWPSTNQRTSMPPTRTHNGVEYVFFDVETPNSHNDRVCSIAAIRADEFGNTIDKAYSLVNPDAEFGAVNVGIHGITEFDVRSAPNFPMVWNRFSPIFHNAILVAHNANFDLTVLDKTMDAYGIEHGAVKYVDTMAIATERLNGLGKYRLDVVCAACGIPLNNHHNAMDDANACMGVFYTLGIPMTFDEYIPISQRRKNTRTYNVVRSEGSKAHNELMRHAMDILEDGHVSLEEAIGLRWWLDKEVALAGDTTACELLGLLSSVLQDGVVDLCEEQQIIAMLNRIVNPASDEVADGIDGKRFCLTGDFDFGTKDEVTEHLVRLGGISSKSVTKTCNYVIVGNQGSSAYAHGSYGGKVKKAMEWQSKGVPMRIVSERDCPWL